MTTSLTGAALAIELLLCELRNGTFYQDHDESLMMLHDAEEALNLLADAAIVKKPFNTNDYVWVRLNDLGWRVFDEDHTHLGLDPAPYRKIVTTNNPEYQRFQLHELMHIFGPQMSLGFNVPFKDNVIYFEDPT